MDAAYGGYCVFAEVDAKDAASFETVDRIAADVKRGNMTVIQQITVC